MVKLSLKWADFTPNLHKSFQNLRKEEDFFDVTLVGDDFKYVTAHKVVLSSSSEYFKKVFSNNKKYFQSHALICLEGLTQSDLNNILDYIYHGELQIYKQDLDRFLGIAERLKLEGLQIGEWQHKNEADVKTRRQTMKNSEVNVDVHNKQAKLDRVQETLPLVSQRKNTTSQFPWEAVKTGNISEEDIFIQNDDSHVPQQESKRKKDVKMKEKPVISVQASDIKSLDELDRKVDECYSSRDSKGFFGCKYCAMVFKARGHIREHVEIHFDGLSFPCKMCDSPLRTRAALRHHYKNKHGAFMKDFQTLTYYCKS